jgi:glutathione S-transferase
MPDPILYGPAYSTYTRSVRMTLMERAIPYKLVEVDVMKGDGETPEHLRRHPYGKVPVLDKDGFVLYETDAILRYIDDAMPGTKLTPMDMLRRARMNQIMGIIDSYLYKPAIQGVFIPRVVAPMKGQPVDEDKIAAELPAAQKALGEIEKAAAPTLCLCGQATSLADLLLAPIMAYFTMTPESEPTLKKLPKLTLWWAHMRERRSLKATAPDFSGAGNQKPDVRKERSAIIRH